MKVLYFTTLILSILCGYNCYAKVIIKDEEKSVELESSTNFSVGYVQDNENRFSNNKEGTVLLDSSIRFLCLRNVDHRDNLGTTIKLSGKFTSYKSDPLDINVDEAHIFFKTQNRGTLKLGFDDTVEKTMGSKIYFGAGGINGRWADLANLRGFNKANDGPGYDTNGVFWVKPDLYIDYKGIKSLRMSYYSPKIRGVQIGFNYLPGNDDTGYQNVVSGAVTYNKCAFKNIDYSLSLAGELANENLARRLNKLQTWSAGLDLKYKNIEYVISYGNIGKSGRINSPDTYYINTGIAYYHDSWRSSFTYFTSTRGNRDLSSWAVNWEKYFAKNASYYVDFIGFNTKEPTDSSNSGIVFLTGFKFQF